MDTEGLATEDVVGDPEANVLENEVTDKLEREGECEVDDEGGAQVLVAQEEVPTVGKRGGSPTAAKRKNTRDRASRGR